VIRRAAAIAALLAIGAAPAACGGRAPGPGAPLSGESAGGAGAAVEDAGPAQPSAKAELPRRRAGEIRRADLDRVLDAGPGRFLATVEVRARLVDGAFRGWEVRKSPWDDVDLLPGDLLLDVNGRSLQHPLELKVLWDDLRRASTITAKIDRRGERFTLRFAVVPQSGPA
jgi:S1-C subfamily serine protease